MRRWMQRAIGATALTIIFAGCMRPVYVKQDEAEKRVVPSNEGDGVLQQEGPFPTLRRGVEQKVSYPIPFASPPNLQLSDEFLVIVEQRPDYFVIRSKENFLEGVLRWTARGVPDRPVPVETPNR